MRLSLATRIFLGYAVVLATFGAVSLFSIAEMHQNQVEIRLVSDGYLHLAQDAAAIETFHATQAKDHERLIGTKSFETRRSLIHLSRLYFPGLMMQKLNAARERAEGLSSFAPDSEKPFIREVLDRLDELFKRYGEYLEVAERAYVALELQNPDWARANAHVDQLTLRENAIRRQIEQLRVALEQRIRERVASTEKRERRAGWTIIALSLLAITVGLLAWAFAARSLRPVKTLIEGVSRIGRGDYSAQLGVRGDDEISVLAREFDQMARSLKEREAQLKEKQEALLRAEQLAAVGRISAQIAHEVRNPLSSIGLNIEMLEEQLAKADFSSETEREEAKDLIAAIIRELDRLTEVTENYLKMARLPKPRLEAEDVNQVLESVLDFSREELMRSHVRVVRELSPESPRALADEGQLRQVFLNLLRNSREAMPRGGQLTVRSSVVNGHVKVVFQDTGGGIPGPVKERLFEPFFSTKEGGTGLGLAVSRQILQAHGGSIECESTPGGTTFVITLQRAETPSPSGRGTT